MHSRDIIMFSNCRCNYVRLLCFYPTHNGDINVFNTLSYGHILTKGWWLSYIGSSG